MEGRMRLTIMLMCTTKLQILPEGTQASRSIFRVSTEAIHALLPCILQQWTISFVLWMNGKRTRLPS